MNLERRDSGERDAGPPLTSGLLVNGRNGTSNVVHDQIVVDGDGGRGSLPRRGDDLRSRVRDVAGSPRARHAGTSDGVRDDPARLVECAADRAKEAAVGDEAGPHERGASVDDAAVVEFDAGEAIVLDHQAAHRAVHDTDSAGSELVALVVRERDGVAEHNDVGAPLADQLRVLERIRGAAKHADRLIAHLPAMAIRAMQHVPSPPVDDSGDGQQLVPESGRDEHAAGAHRTAVRGQFNLEPSGILGKSGDCARDDFPGVATHLVAPDRKELTGRKTIPGQIPVHVRGRRVARTPGINHGNSTAGPSQDQRCRQPGRAAAHDHTSYRSGPSDIMGS
jgi:hypothetical protein